MSIIGKLKHGVHHAVHQVTHEVDHDVHDVKHEVNQDVHDVKHTADEVTNEVKHEVNQIYDEVIKRLEDSTSIFLHAIENGLIEHAVDEAVELLQKSRIQPPSFRIGFEFWNLGFHITIDKIPEKLPILLQYAEGKKSLRSAKNIKDFVLALSPTSLKPTIFGNGADFSSEQIYDVIDNVLHRLGIE